MTVFISKFVRLYDVLLFQNKHICMAIYGPQFESLVSHLQVRMNEGEMLYFHSKLSDPARGTNSEHLGNVFVFAWAYKIKRTCFENNFCPSLLAKSQKPRGGGTHDILGRGCATIKSLYRPFLEFLTNKLDPFRNFCA